jgi:osmoprotectant transport system permease protein
MKLRYVLLAALCMLALAPRLHAQSAEKVAVGSKAFPESWILGEALTSLATEAGAQAEHKSSLGGTDIVYKALQTGSVDVYAEYTGTISEVILKAPNHPSPPEINAALKAKGLGISESLGFNDGYALAVTEATQQKYGLRKISDLAAHPELRLGFTHEFVGRKDGWAGLAQHYGLKMPNVSGIEHQLAYQAIAGGQIDLMEIYTTDAKIQKFHLKLLEDDRHFFPRYDAVLLYRLDLPQRAPKAFAAMQRLVGKIDEARMIRANALVELEKQSRQEAASALLSDALGAGAAPAAVERPNMWAEIGKDTARHLELVAVSLLAAIIAGIPLGILAARSRALASVTLSGAGVLQTIPSLALLAFLIPVLGTGPVPAMVALFLYSLLPIVRNTYVGLTTIPPHLAEAAEALGLPPLARLLRITLPMASPSIMAGIKTSAVINVGTATLAALIGGGGLGDPILRGIQLTDTPMVLQGAIPAAVLALVVQWGFDLLDRLVIPRGLRL